MSHTDFYNGLPGDPISAHIDGECSPEDPLPAGMDGQVRFEAATWPRRTFSGGASGGEGRTRLWFGVCDIMASRVVEKFAALPNGSRAWMTEPSRVTEVLCMSRLGGSRSSRTAYEPSRVTELLCVSRLGGSRSSRTAYWPVVWCLVRHGTRVLDPATEYVIR
jgi:hypothetical protein